MARRFDESAFREGVESAVNTHFQLGFKNTWGHCILVSIGAHSLHGGWYEQHRSISRHTLNTVVLGARVFCRLEGELLGKSFAAGLERVNKAMQDPRQKGQH